MLLNASYNKIRNLKIFDLLAQILHHFIGPAFHTSSRRTNKTLILFDQADEFELSTAVDGHSLNNTKKLFISKYYFIS